MGWDPTRRRDPQPSGNCSRKLIGWPLSVVERRRDGALGSSLRPGAPVPTLRGRMLLGQSQLDRQFAGWQGCTEQSLTAAKQRGSGVQTEGCGAGPGTGLQHLPCQRVKDPRRAGCKCSLLWVKCRCLYSQGDSPFPGALTTDSPVPAHQGGLATKPHGLWTRATCPRKQQEAPWTCGTCGTACLSQSRGRQEEARC